MEHLEHFGLKRDPFQNEPDLRFYFHSTSHQDAQRRVDRALRQSKGLSLLSGESGTGKTLLARRILDGLEDEIFDASLMVMMRGSAGAASLMRRFARQLEVAEPASDQAGVMSQVYEKLAMVREEGRHTVLIIDDAQLMGTEALAEVGTLTNFEYEERRLLSILLVGTEELESALAEDESLGQRVDVRVRLQALDAENSAAYLAHRIGIVNGQSYIIPSEAMDALYKLGKGRPRLMNTLADNALFEAFLAGRPTMNATDVETAAADLGIEGPSGPLIPRAPAPRSATRASPVSPAPRAPVAIFDAAEQTEPMVETVFEAALAETEPIQAASVEPFEATPVVVAETSAGTVFEAEAVAETTTPFEDDAANRGSSPFGSELQRAADAAADAVSALQDDAPTGPDSAELDEIFIELGDD